MNQSKHDTLAHPGSPQAGASPDTNGSPLDGRGQEAEELTYEPVPPKKTVTVSVHYRIRGRGRPLPYPLDEGDGQ
jgi:hypothetical protein